MAQEEGEDKKAEEAPVKKKSKLPLIIGIVVVLLIAGGAGAFFFMKSAKKENKEEISADAAQEEGLESESAADAEEELEEGEEPLGALFPLDPFVVNLNGGRYIRLQIQIEFSDRDIPKRFMNRIPVIRDGIIGLLNKMTSEKVLSENGRDSIKNQIKDVVNEVLRKEEVKKVYLTQFIVQ
jgi:flagellar FliL protein